MSHGSMYPYALSARFESSISLASRPQPRPKQRSSHPGNRAEVRVRPRSQARSGPLAYRVWRTCFAGCGPAAPVCSPSPCSSPCAPQAPEPSLLPHAQHEDTRPPAHVLPSAIAAAPIYPDAHRAVREPLHPSSIRFAPVPTIKQDGPPRGDTIFRTREQVV